MSTLDFDPELLEQLREQIQSKHADLSSKPAAVGVKPLPLECKMTSCKHGRHFLDFLRKPHKESTAVSPGTCRDCSTPALDEGTFVEHKYGAPEQLVATFSGQQHELMRAHYWLVPIDLWAYNQALRFGRDEVLRRVEKQVRWAMTSTDAWANKGSPYSRQIVAYAQHATATCCRDCAAYWHGLPKDRAMRPTEAQLQHVVWAAQAWVHLRLQDVGQDGVTVASIRSTALPSPAQNASLDDKVLDALVRGVDPAGLVVPDKTTLNFQPYRGRLLVSRTLAVSA